MTQILSTFPAPSQASLLPQHFLITTGHFDHSYFSLKLIPYTATNASLILDEETSQHTYFHFLPLFPYFILRNSFQILGSVNYLLIYKCFSEKSLYYIFMYLISQEWYAMRILLVSSLAQSQNYQFSLFHLLNT